MIFERMNLRLPANLKSWLKERADTQHRTMNGEIVALLERAKIADTKEAA